MKSPEEIAKEIGLWLYGPDEGFSEGIVRTLIDKIAYAIKDERSVLAEKESEHFKRGQKVTDLSIKLQHTEDDLFRANKSLAEKEAIIEEFVKKNDFAGLLNTHFERGDVVAHERRQYKKLEAQLSAQAQVIGRMKDGINNALGMLGHVGCVQNCNGGVIQTSENECHQCQWCDEIDQIKKLVALPAESSKECLACDNPKKDFDHTCSKSEGEEKEKV